MPVLVTVAESGAARAVITRLLRTRGEVRAYLDPEAVPEGLVDAYRRCGVKVARGRLEDESRLEAALEQTHTVVHAGGGLLDEPTRVVDDVASVTSAALGAGCRRVIWASHLDAGTPGTDPYLAACADAEALLADAPLESVVVRRSLTYGPNDPLTAVLAAGLDGVDVHARHAPLYVDDLAAAVVAADAHRGREGPRHIVVSLAGPEVVKLARLLDGLARSGLPPPPPDVGAPAHLAALLSRDQVPGPGTLGRTGTPLPEGLAQTRSAGAGDPSAPANG